MRMSLEEIRSALGLPSGSGDAEITGVCIDSRQCKPGDMFICIPGARADGHDFARRAAESGASAVLAQKEISDPGVPVLKTDDTVKALGRLAAYWREKSKAMVIGVTGTAGKTTLKETLSGILSQNGRIAKTEKNHNNQIGLPCAILAADGDEDWWIMEMGISRHGDMDELGEILKPDLAVIINAAAGHCEGLGEKGTAWHKSRILKYIREGGQALVSADYPELVEECEKFSVAVNYFSIRNDSSPRRLVDRGGQGEYVFQLSKGLVRFKTPFVGEYGAETALAAASVADLLNMDTDLAQRGFESAVMPEDRLNLISRRGWNILNDTYNANPLSMRRMIEAARERAGAGNLVLVLGEMHELGEQGGAMHYEAGRACALARPAAVFWHGGFAGEVLQGLEDGGFNSACFFPVDNPESFASSFGGLNIKTGTALFKGSRCMRMERFLKKFEEIADAPAGEKNVL